MSLPKSIESIEFRMMSTQDIAQISELEVIESKLYEEDSYVPKAYGLLDPRLGVSTKSDICQTWKSNYVDCPGHYGYIKLELPVYHIGFFKHIITILQWIWKGCSRFLLSDKERKIILDKKIKITDPMQRDEIRRKMIDDCKKVINCEFCGYFNGTVKKEPGIACKITHDLYNIKKRKDDEMDNITQSFENILKINKDVEWGLNKMQQDINPLIAYNLLKNIRKDDIPLFDMNGKNINPWDMIVYYIIVPPVCLRPSVAVTETKRNEDDLTVKLSEIIQLNMIIKSFIVNGQNYSKLSTSWNQLQYTLAQYINADTPGLPLNMIGNKAIRAFCQRLKGKQGRFRGNLSGKRVDFSGRTVISPDPNAEIGQVVVPVDMAKIFTFPVWVNEYNIEFLKKLIKNGSEVHPGANFVQFQNGIKMKIRENNSYAICKELKIGDIVERHLIDGDSVLFNRQPSLHRLSIMCHKAKVMPWKTLRFNECCCGPYNADFDGDEMNIHLPQTYEAKAEASILMNVVNNLVTPKNGEPLIAATQDFLTASFLLTNKDQFYDQAEFCKICSYFWIDDNEIITIPPPAILKPMKLWTGKQVISLLIRQNYKSNIVLNIELEEKNYTDNTFQMCPWDGYVIFSSSELMWGNLGKATLGGGSKRGLFYTLIRNWSSEIAAKWMLRLSKFASRWISNYGMSIGISDVTPFGINEKKAEIIKEGYVKCEKFIEKFHLGKLNLKAGWNAEQTLESELNGVLSDIREKAGKLLKNTLPRTNSPLIMATCGSKGSYLNLSQMIAWVGQQTVNGQRIPEGFINRTLPHFDKNSKSPDAKGFWGASFYNGLNATEFFFHTVGGREGLVDTAVKTAETGYMQRRLIKSLEDLSVKYDYSVRTSTGQMIQFLYGDDGLDPMNIDIVDFNEEKKSWSCPVNFSRIVTRVKEETKSNKSIHKEDNLDPFEIKELLESSITLNKTENKYVTENFWDDLRLYVDFNFINKLAQIRKVLGYSENIERKHKSKTNKSEDKIIKNFFTLTNSQFIMFLKYVWKYYEQSMVVPGEAVGAVSAQSIGEPGTQMTLKTFHFAGVASMNITLGVPRIKEIINASKTISTPIISAELYNKNSEISARIIKGHLERTLLGDITEYIKEVYTKTGCFLLIKLDLETIDNLKLDLNINQVVYWITKAPLLKIKKNISILSDCKIKIDPHETSRDKMYGWIQHMKIMLPKVLVKGIPNITRAVINKSDEENETFNLIVEGYGLKEVMLTPGVIPEHTKSNHIIEVEEVLGIEAARNAIIHEIQYTMKSHGIFVDPRHISLLADVMTFKGRILGITRFGVSKMKDSTLMLASFEQTTDHLFNAATFNRKDNITGVSECIITGNILPVGTGIFKVFHSDESLDLYNEDESGNKISKNLVCESPEMTLLSELIK